MKQTLHTPGADTAQRPPLPPEPPGMGCHHQVGCHEVHVTERQQPKFALANPATLAVPDLPTARAVVNWFSGQAKAQGLTLRAPPPEPTTCCGRGCNGCVWEGFYTALHHWRSDAVAALAASLPGEATPATVAPER